MYFEIITNQAGQDKLTAKKHFHDNTFEIIHVLSGSGNLIIGKNIYSFKKGDVFLFDASSLHCTAPGIPEEYVRNKLIIEKQALLSLTDKLKYNLYFNAGNKLSERFGELFSKAKDASLKEENEMLVISHILKIFHLCYMNKSDISPVKKGFAFKIIDYVNTHLSEECSLDFLAKQIHMSKYHMCRKFKDETGITVHGYIKSLKISRAKKLLSKNDLSITEIAYETGFADTACFTKAFKSETGITPSLFRKIHNSQSK